eukprot:10514121-Heterocapsa_arctica.AAC.1
MHDDAILSHSKGCPYCELTASSLLFTRWFSEFASAGPSPQNASRGVFGSTSCLSLRLRAKRIEGPS